jgi:hypothetical protein
LITPLIFGGAPADATNRTPLTRDQHVQVVQYWNKVIRGLKRDGKWPGATGDA